MSRVIFIITICLAGLILLCPCISVAEEIKTSSGALVYISKHKWNAYYHMKYTLTPENVELTLPTYFKYGPSKYDFNEGCFQIFIPKEEFPIPAPNCTSHIILRMPSTLKDYPKKQEYIAEKESLYDRIKAMKESSKGSIEVIIELNPYVKVINENPLSLELTYCNAFFRDAHGRYADYVGPLRGAVPRVNKKFIK